jgi:GNAT superfamily N-acetyltransferase
VNAPDAAPPPSPPARAHLAQVNIARMRAPLDSAEMAGFVARIAEVNALADGSPGFVWRLATGEGNSTYLRPYDDDRILFNMSVWASIEALRAFVYKSSHTEVMRRRSEWFEKLDGAYVALWWVPAGHVPFVEEAKARLEHLDRHGATPTAFTFKTIFPPPGTGPGRAVDVEIRREELTSPLVRALIADLDAEIRARYPEDGASFLRLEPEEVAPGRGAFVGARAAGRLVGCGAVRRLDAATAEVKRMFVKAEARGQGIGRLILAALEGEALALGVRRLVLETGDRQPEALALYERAGFARIPAFGEYVGAPLSVCMGKELF